MDPPTSGWEGPVPCEAVKAGVTWDLWRKGGHRWYKIG